MGCNPRWLVSQEEGNLDTEKHRESIMWKMKAEIGETLLQEKGHQELGRGVEHSPSQPSEGTNPVDTLISDFYPPKL